MGDEKCVLVGNKFANAMQVVVAVTATLILILHKLIIEDRRIYKWINDCYIRRKGYGNLDWAYRAYDKSQKRSWTLWISDNLKQGFSTAGAHIWGTIVSILLSNYLEETDECAWFFLQFIVDTTIAVGLSILISKYSIKLIECCSYRFAKKWLSIGKYNTDMNTQGYKIWIVQTLHWFFCSMVARMFCTGLLVLGHSIGIKFSTWFSNEWNNKHAELVFVILIIPMIMDTLQLLIQNWYLHWISPLLTLDQQLSINIGDGTGKQPNFVAL